MPANLAENHDASCQELALSIALLISGGSAMTIIPAAPAPFSLDDPRASAATPRDGRHDFDFFVGRWRVAHRRLRKRLEGDTQWDEFAGSGEMRPLLGRLGNIDDNVIELPGGTYRGSTLRLFDPATRLWSIWWMDSRAPRLEPPVHGRFERGIGTFLGEDMFQGRSILVRFIWSEISATTARWEQAFSPDAGASWEVNWIMQFRR
jgi:hypothetical protein